MRTRDFGALAGADDGATATWSVAACIWGGLRRQNAIENPPLTPLRAADRPSSFPSSVTPIRRGPPIKSGTADADSPGAGGAYDNHENVNKSKGPDESPGLCFGVWKILKQT